MIILARPRRGQSSKRQRGLTLLELLIALAIFSLISLMSYGGLKTVLDGREGGERVADRLSEIEIAFSIFERDLLQIVKRPIRGSYGERESAFIGNEEESLLEFTRGGRSNPLHRIRSSLLRVRYQFVDGVWYRKSWAVLDRAHDSNPLEEQLMSEVESLDFRYMNQQQEWTREWRIPVGSAENFTDIERSQVNFPVAVEVTMDIKGWGRMRRLLMLSLEG